MKKSFRISIQVTWGITALCVLSMLLMYVLSTQGIDWRTDWFFLFFSIPLLLFCAILLPVLYYLRKKYMKGAAELLAGEYLAHWQYESDEWNRFIEGEWLRTKKQALWFPLGIVGGVIVLGYLFKGWRVNELKLILPWIFGLAVLAALFIYYYGQRNYRRGLEKVGEVYIGDRGVHFNGTYYTWDYFGAKLGKVELLKGDPPVLQFEIRQISRYGTNSSEVRVPVPRKHEKEAEDLVLKFSA